MKAKRPGAGWVGMALCALLAAPAAAMEAPGVPAQPQPGQRLPAGHETPASGPEGAPAHACPAEPKPPSQERLQAAMRNAHDRGFLWRITRDGHSSYLYGTMHVGKLEWVFPGPKVMEALRATDTMALEMDLLDPQIQADMQKSVAALHPEALPPALEARIRKDAAAMCVSWSALADSPPELQMVVLDMMAGREEGLEAAYATDTVLAGIGHEAHKRMISLETPASQLQALMMKNREETIAYVQDNLDDLESDSARKLLKRLALAWANADYEEMARYPEWCQCLRTGIERKVMARMLDERNPKMAERIDALHREGANVFAAVGSLHMFGPGGLPALLAKKGYTVERIALAPAAEEKR